jgi:hypothetical protein
MKCVPETLLESTVGVTVKPVYEDKGRLLLKILYPRDNNNVIIEKPYTVFIDEQAVDLTGGAIILDSGTHHLSVLSDFYRNETRALTIPKAQTLPLEITLTGIAPQLLITAPEGSEVLLDGEKIELPKKAFSIEPGDHVIKFTLGGYETIKNIHAVNGKTYSVVIAFDVDILETP